MTNEEAIKLLNDITSYCDFTDEYGDMINSDSYYEALDLAIKALEQQPCEDCISREDAIRIASINSMPVNECVRLIKELPSVTPKYTDEEIDRAQAVEQTYIDKMVELTVEEWCKNGRK